MPPITHPRKLHITLEDADNVMVADLSASLSGAPRNIRSTAKHRRGGGAPAFRRVFPRRPAVGASVAVVLRTGIPGGFSPRGGPAVFFASNATIDVNVGAVSAVFLRPRLA